MDESRSACERAARIVGSRRSGYAGSREARRLYSVQILECPVSQRPREDQPAAEPDALAAVADAGAFEPRRLAAATRALALPDGSGQGRMADRDLERSHGAGSFDGRKG